MTAGAHTTPVAHPRWLSRAAIAVAAWEILCSLRLGSEDYAMTAAIAWVAALTVARERGAAPNATPALSPFESIARAAGGALVLTALVGTALVSDYRALVRIFPLLAGAGLALLGAGTGAARSWRELGLLALPLVNPIPTGLRLALEPPVVATTARAAALVSHAIGRDVTLQGNTLVMPDASLEIVESCSGILGMTRLLVLAVLLLALFPTTWRQRAALAASALGVGFAVNVGRIVFLGAVAAGEDARFDFWDSGRGSITFSLVATAIAGVVWWLILRQRGAVAATAPEPAARVT